MCISDVRSKCICRSSFVSELGSSFLPKCPSEISKSCSDYRVLTTYLPPLSKVKTSSFQGLAWEIQELPKMTPNPLVYKDTAMLDIWIETRLHGSNLSRY